MKKYEKSSSDPSELRDSPDLDLEFPVPTKPLHSWNGCVDPGAVLEFAETQLARVWSNPEFVKQREACRILVPFEM
jgi:hypothetical protein